MRRIVRLVALAAAVSLAARSGNAQTSIAGVGAVLHPLNVHDIDTATGLTTFADGPRLVMTPSGGIWFLEANADRVAYFANDTITEWPIRSHSYSDPYRHIGANPSEFELDSDGHTIWFVENGTSGIELNESVFGKLDTATNTMSEWILPIAKPSSFYRENDGVTVWIAMSQGALVRFRMDTLEVTSFRASDSLAYSGLVLGADGFFYLTDFGDNRIVRVDRQSLTEKAWTVIDPNVTRINLTQPTLDGAGGIFVAEEVDGGGISRLDLTTGVYTRYSSLFYPSHFLLQSNFIYAVETGPSSADGAIAILNKDTVATTTVTITPTSEAFIVHPELSATTRTTTLTPITFQSSDKDPDGLIVATAPATGVSVFTIPHGSTFGSTTSFSIAIRDGKVLSGIEGALAEFTLLPAAESTELIAPVAMNAANAAIRTDFILNNSKAGSTSLSLNFYATPVPPAPNKVFSFNKLVGTQAVANQLGTGALAVGDAVGSLRFTPAAADPPGAYSVISRTYAVRPDGSTYGYLLPAVPVASGVTTGSNAVLPLAGDASEISIFGIYAPNGASGTATLHSPNGSVRGVYSIDLPSNNRVEFNPAFGAFGVPAEAGDYVTFSISSGNVFPYATFSETTGDAAVEQPVAPVTSMGFPIIGSGRSSLGFHYASDISFVNPDAEATANVTVWFHPFDTSQLTAIRTLSIPPGVRRSLAFDLETPAFGAVIVESTSPVAAVARIAHKTSLGDYACVAAPLTASGNSRFLVSGDRRLTVNLPIYNRGGDGIVSVEGFDAAGKSKGKILVGIPGHSPAQISNVAAAVGLANAPGSIEVRGVYGHPSIFAWLTTAERITGDPDVEPPFFITP